MRQAVLLCASALVAVAQPPMYTAPAHDPSTMTQDGDRYWVFTTGPNIPAMSASTPNFTDWRQETSPFAHGSPSWIGQYVPGFFNDFWAPEVVKRGDEFRLYYACSAFGQQTSAIGMATAAHLAGPWTDQGVVVYTNASSQENAIDPAIFADGDNGDWLIYGSFFGGIRMTKLNANGKPVSNERIAVASGDCEASYLEKHGSYYYLLINRGKCCEGVQSTTYRIQVGRSENVTGPFYDKDGVDMNKGGGTTFVQGTSGRFIGPGQFGYGCGKLTYHFYDGEQRGTPKLMVAELDWTADGWPHASTMPSNMTYAK